MFLVRWIKRLWGGKRVYDDSTKSWKRATSSGRHFWQSKEWRAGVVTLVGVILAVAAGEIPLSLDSLQEHIPILILVAGGIFAMFQGAGRTRLEREMANTRLVLQQLDREEQIRNSPIRRALNSLSTAKAGDRATPGGKGCPTDKLPGSRHI